jgi:hypothetical protein
MDVEITFLHGALIEKNYMHQPPSFEQLGTKN